MVTRELTEKFIKDAVYFISTQQIDGSFKHLSSKHENDFRESDVYNATFFTSLILCSLSNLEESVQLNLIKNKAEEFLLKEKSQDWSFNYWERLSREAVSMPYPDDLDDTFAALSGLTLIKPSVINGSVLAKIVKLLAFTEEKPGGPYRTWLTPKSPNSSWQDVDIAVNSNIGFFLSLHNVSLQELNKYISESINSKQLLSKYYPSVIPIIYFLSRWYDGEDRYILVNSLTDLKTNKGDWGSILNNSLAVSALINLSAPVFEFENAVELIVGNGKFQEWKALSFCFDPSQKGIAYYSGSPALTAAFSAEALSKYLSIISTNKITNFSYEENDFYAKVLQNIRESFSILLGNFQRNSLLVLEKNIKGNVGKEIILQVFWFVKSMGKRASNFSGSAAMELSTSNIMGWMAYDIYDDFLDLEGEVSKLSVANFCLRELTKIYVSLLGNKYTFFKQVMDKLDGANVWEVESCRVNLTSGSFQIHDRLPKYNNLDNLSNRSLGHAMGPVAVLLRLGYGEDSVEVKGVMDFFRNYLAARQLNDDAHDWWEDLQKGMLNSTSVLVLEKFGGREVNFERDGDRLKQIFWYEVIPGIAQRVFGHLDKATEIITGLEIIEKPDKLLEMLRPLRIAAQKALDQSKQVKDFLQEIG